MQGTKKLNPLFPLESDSAIRPTWQGAFFPVLPIWLKLAAAAQADLDSVYLPASRQLQS